MDGKIDRNGFLYIKRGKKMKTVLCPFCAWNTFEKMGQTQIEQNPCGDWCVLFGEPEIAGSPLPARIVVCHDKELWFNEFTDEREVE